MAKSGEPKESPVEDRRQQKRRDEDGCPFKDLRDALNTVPRQNTNGREEPKFSQFQQWLITFLIGGVVLIFIWWSNNVNDSDKRQMEKLTAIDSGVSSLSIKTTAKLDQLEGDIRRVAEDLKLHLQVTPLHSFIPNIPNPRR